MRKNVCKSELIELSAGFTAVLGCQLAEVGSLYSLCCLAE